MSNIQGQYVGRTTDYDYSYGRNATLTTAYFAAHGLCTMDIQLSKLAATMDRYDNMDVVFHLSTAQVEEMIDILIKVRNIMRPKVQFILWFDNEDGERESYDIVAENRLDAVRFVLRVVNAMRDQAGKPHVSADMVHVGVVKTDGSGEVVELSDPLDFALYE